MLPIVSRMNVPSTYVNGQTKFLLMSKQVQNGTMYKGNNDVARSFIGCHVVSIMILPVQYAFVGPVH